MYRRNDDLLPDFEEDLYLVDNIRTLINTSIAFAILGVSLGLGVGWLLWA